MGLMKYLKYAFHIIPISMLYGSLSLVDTYPAIAVICGYLSGIVSSAVSDAIRRNS